MSSLPFEFLPGFQRRRAAFTEPDDGCLKFRLGATGSHRSRPAVAPPRLALGRRAPVTPS